MKIRQRLGNRYFLLALAALLLGGLGYAYWQFSLGGGTGSEARYRTQKLERGDLNQLASANGTLNPVVLVNVGTQVSGTVKKWYADYNDQVVAGQKLLELDPSIYRAQVKLSSAAVANAASQLRLAEANQLRAEELFRQEYISRQELDTATQALEAGRAQLAQSKAQLEKDKTNLDYSVIRSPVSGVVVSREVDLGQTVAASFQTPTLFKIAQDLSKMQIDSSYAEADVGNIHVGQEASFRVDAHPSRLFRGRVRQVRLNPTTLQNVVTYDVVIAVDNPEQILMPGMTAYVSILVAQRQAVLLVPNAALRFRPAEPSIGDKQPESQGKSKGEAQGGGTIYLLQAGKPKPVRVRLGISDNRLSEVSSAELAVGMDVIVEDRAPPAKTTSGPGLRLF